MKIDRKHAISTGLGNQVRHQLCRNRGTRAGFAVLAGISEVGNHRGDPLGRGTAQRIDADQQFHQVVVRGIARRLDDEDIFAANVLVDLHENLFVGKTAHTGVGQRLLKIGGNARASGRLLLPDMIFIANPRDARPPAGRARPLVMRHGNAIVAARFFDQYAQARVALGRHSPSQAQTRDPPLHLQGAVNRAYSQQINLERARKLDA